MIPIEEMSIEELAAHVCDHLRAGGIDVVLSGGACVTIYSQNRYQSYDLDFIENVSSSKKMLDTLLGSIGFEQTKDRYYKNPKTQYFLEFPPGPLAIGEQPITQTATREVSGKTLKLLTPTDCIKDRLASYFYFNDRQCLEQALMIARE